MVTLPNIGGALCSMPQSLADFTPAILLTQLLPVPQIQYVCLHCVHYKCVYYCYYYYYYYLCFINHQQYVTIMLAIFSRYFVFSLMVLKKPISNSLGCDVRLSSPPHPLRRISPGGHIKVSRIM